MTLQEIQASNSIKFEDIQKAAETFCQIFIDTVAPIFKAVAEFIRIFGDHMYLCAEKEYLKHHSCLPGSKKTKRLRKKRHTAVMNWYIDKLKGVK